MTAPSNGTVRRVILGVVGACAAAFLIGTGGSLWSLLGDVRDIKTTLDKVVVPRIEDHEARLRQAESNARRGPWGAPYGDGR